jgi:uncharacterized protein (DUF1015 family)
MTVIDGLVGLRPHPDHVTGIVAPPYDVIKPGTPLEKLLQQRPDNLCHVTLGADPVGALAALRASGHLIEDDEPAFYVYEQCWASGRRLGVFTATAVSDYSQHQVIRHEKTFDSKVQGRIALAQATRLTIEPVFLLTKAAISALLERALAELPACYAFASDFGGHNDLHGLDSRIVRLPASHELGQALIAAVGTQPLYIADGHHRYHAALKNGQSHLLAYIVEDAAIQAYNRVINGRKPFAEIVSQLALTPCDSFHTPAKHQFCLYHQGRSYLLKAQRIPADVVGRLDCSILERELYPLLGLDHSMIIDERHFDYFPESQLDQMQAVVDAGRYDLAVALAPVDLDELMAVADAGLGNPEVVMPEKSTFFAPKILSGLFLYRH